MYIYSFSNVIFFSSYIEAGGIDDIEKHLTSDVNNPLTKMDYKGADLHGTFLEKEFMVNCEFFCKDIRVSGMLQKSRSLDFNTDQQ